ncbi:hypothetical protein [Mesorhizobium cantuariense]|uniref:Uncharacterized protein n=1 Tax=Mesorhizobium cantuariense TaxID=1300275 RepID=A0ABV7MVV6_9HYPH
MRFEYGSSSNTVPVSRKRDYQASTSRVNASVDACDLCYIGCQFLPEPDKTYCLLGCDLLCN